MALEYPKSYGSWAGSRHGTKPDHTRCAESVTDPGMWSSAHQCRRKAKYDPDENGNPTACKVHSEGYIAEKRRAADEKYNAAMAKHRVRWNAQVYYDTLVKIAEGHNDPRGLANEVLKRGKS